MRPRIFMHRLFIAILSLCLSVNAFAQKKLTPAQKKFTDSVNKALVGQADSTKHKILITLFEKNRNRSYNRAIIVGRKVIPFMRKRGNLEQLAVFYLHMAQLECRSGEENASIPFYREAARIYKSLH